MSGVNTLGGRAGTCEEALGTLYATPEVAGRFDEASRSLRVLDVQVTGDDAVVTGAFGRSGPPVETGLRRVDGRWRLLTPPKS